MYQRRRRSTSGSETPTTESSNPSLDTSTEVSPTTETEGTGLGPTLTSVSETADPAALATQTSTMDYCRSRGCEPGNSGTFAAEAMDAVQRLTSEQKRTYAAAGLTEEELVAVAFYTTNAAYGINAVLRGLIFDEVWVAAFKPWGDKAAAAVRKMPEGARNSQGDAGMLDPTKGEDEIISLEAVYRNMDWSPFFTPVFTDEWKEGRMIQDNGFMSTTLIKDSYGPNMSVKSTIEKVSDAKVIQALSVYPSENEALLPPGTQLRINDIVDRDTNAKVADPGRTYGASLEDHKFDIAMEIVQAPPTTETAPTDTTRVDSTDPLAAALDRAPPLGG